MGGWRKLRRFIVLKKMKFGEDGSERECGHTHQPTAGLCFWIIQDMLVCVVVPCARPDALFSLLKEEKEK